MSLKILICSSEVVPFAKTGGLADVAGALPKALAVQGHEVAVILPKYGSIDAKKVKSKQLVSGLAFAFGSKSYHVNIAVSDAIPGVKNYLVDSPEHFHRKGLYGEPDDAKRFAVFCYATLEFLRQQKWKPQVIHGNDWQTGLIPVLLKTSYAKDRELSGIATLHTVHNLAYQGVFDYPVLDEIGLDRSLFTMEKLEFYGKVNLLKGALIYADILNTVSPTYAKEIQTPEFGERLEGVMLNRKQDLFGVLNGLDYEEWNPATDLHIPAQFQADNLAPKSEDKAALQKRVGLPCRPEAPLFGLVSRLAGQKGLDILVEVLPHLLRLDVQFVLLGTGEAPYHELLNELAKRHPSQMAVALGFDNPLAHLIYAGSDFFLMPSRFEPCGLGQMISLRYGSIPIVRHTGGLVDTVSNFDPATGQGNGFAFTDYTSIALMGAIVRGLLTIKVTPAWSRLVQNALASDFSWERSAKAYVALYERARKRVGG